MGRGILAVFGGVCGLLTGVAVHELAHASILRHYGCGYSFGIEGLRPYTYAGAGCVHQLTPEQYQRLILVQDVVEAVGYQVVPLFALVGAVLFRQFRS